jgi:hypothetical protein
MAPTVSSIGVAGDKGTVRPPNIVELGGEHDLGTAIPNGFSDHLLIPTHSIDIGGVEKCDAKLDGTVDGGNRLDFVAVSVKIAHTHAAEPER